MLAFLAGLQELAPCQDFTSPRRRVDTQIDVSTSCGTLYTIAALPGAVHVYSVITKQLNTSGINSLQSVLFAFIGPTLGRVALSMVFPLKLVW